MYAFHVGLYKHSPPRLFGNVSLVDRNKRNLVFRAHTSSHKSIRLTRFSQNCCNKSSVYETVEIIGTLYLGCIRLICCRFDPRPVLFLSSPFRTDALFLMGTRLGRILGSYVSFRSTILSADKNKY